MIIYTPLWKNLQKRGLSSYRLIRYYSFSTHTIYRLRHGYGISTELINTFCQILDCRVEDIIEYVAAEEQKTTP